jgi:predicted O-linked N-acetylglucosamine transferase (SPINDLY family)
MDYCKIVSIVDIMLDSFPFGGCNTSLDAFYFNKIVITLPSNKLNGRFTYGFYKKMGIEEPICTNLEEFSVKALYYMNNKEERLKIEKLIEKNKHVLYQEEDSVSTWKNKLIELYENKNDKKSKK